MPNGENRTQTNTHFLFGSVQQLAVAVLGKLGGLGGEWVGPCVDRLDPTEQEPAGEFTLELLHVYFRINRATGERETITLGVENLATWCHELVHAADHRLGNLKEKGQHWCSEPVAELGGCILLHLLGEPEQADSGGAWEYIGRYAREAEIAALAACVEVLERTCQAVSLILETANAG